MQTNISWSFSASSSVRNIRTAIGEHSAVPIVFSRLSRSLRARAMTRSPSIGKPPCTRLELGPASAGFLLQLGLLEVRLVVATKIRDKAIHHEVEHQPSFALEE